MLEMEGSCQDLAATRERTRVSDVSAPQKVGGRQHGASGSTNINIENQR